MANQKTVKNCGMEFDPNNTGENNQCSYHPEEAVHVGIPPHRKGEKHMSYLHVFVDSHQFEEATTALLAGQEEYRLPRQTLRNQYGTFQYVAKLHSREGEKGILVENEVKMYEDINGEWHLVKSTLEFVAFYPLRFITQHMPLLNRDQE